MWCMQHVMCHVINFNKFVTAMTACCKLYLAEFRYLALLYVVWVTYCAITLNQK